MSQRYCLLWILQATVYPLESTDKVITWTSDYPNVATVDDNGKVTAVAPGTVTITAAADGKSATCTVTVPNPAGGFEGTGEEKWVNGCDVLTAIYVPAGRVDTYKAAGGWSDYADKIQAIPAP